MKYQNLHSYSIDEKIFFSFQFFRKLNRNYTYIGFNLFFFQIKDKIK